MRVVGERGSDPDAKPVCGTPRAGRRAVAVAPSFGGWQERRRVRAGTRTRDRPASRTAVPRQQRSSIGHTPGLPAHAGRRKQAKNILSRAPVAKTEMTELCEISSEFLLLAPVTPPVTATGGVRGSVIGSVTGGVSGVVCAHAALLGSGAASFPRLGRPTIWRGGSGGRTRNIRAH
jgi:hypothetical protein